MVTPPSRSLFPRNRGILVFGMLVALSLLLWVGGIEGLRHSATDERLESLDPALFASADSGAPFPRELIDAGGRRLRINAPPRRIVSQTLGTDEILMAICPTRRLAALSALALDPDYSNVAEEVRVLSVPQVEGVEQVLRLEPDLIFVASYSRAEFVDLLSAAGAPVFRLGSFDSIADIKANMRRIGYAIGREEQSEEEIRRMERRMDEARAMIRQSPSPRLMSYTPGGFTAGADTLFDDIARAAGAVNIPAENGVVGFQKIDAEHLAAWEPDFLVVGAGGGNPDSVRGRLLANPAVAACKAAREGRIIVIANRKLMAVSQHIACAVEELVEQLYGDNDARTR